MQFSIASVLVLAGLGLSMPLDHQTDPASVPQQLQGALTQLNGTHIQINITNPNDQAVALLRRHNILHAGAEHFSLGVQPAGNTSVQPGGNNSDHGQLELGVGAVRYIYPRMVQNGSLVRIPAGASWTHQFDISRIFHIPQTGMYEVSLRGAFHHVYTLEGNNSSNHNGSRVHGMHPIHIQSQPLTCELSASAPKIQNRQLATNADALRGCSLTRAKLTANIKAATQMSATAASTVGKNQALTLLYFGIASDKNTQPTYLPTGRMIFSTYHLIAAYNPVVDKHISWNCASNGAPMPLCDSTTIGFYQYSDTSINLCHLFDTLPRSLACQTPGPTAQALDEQESTILHELFHDRTTFAPQDIDDFDDPAFSSEDAEEGCYNYNCATAFAKTRNPQALPEHSAINYEQFAQAARHLAAPGAMCISSTGIPTPTGPKPPTAQQADDKWWQPELRV